MLRTRRGTSFGALPRHVVVTPPRKTTTPCGLNNDDATTITSDDIESVFPFMMGVLLAADGRALDELEAELASYPASPSEAPRDGP